MELLRGMFCFSNIVHVLHYSVNDIFVHIYIMSQAYQGVLVNIHWYVLLNHMFSKMSLFISRKYENFVDIGCRFDQSNEDLGCNLTNWWMVIGSNRSSMKWWRSKDDVQPICLKSI